jgi:nitroreductase
MTELLPLNPDELLTTTRAVRKRLDLERPVPMEVVREALSVALQAPSGSNSQSWQWIVVTDPDVRAQIAAIYSRAFANYTAMVGEPADGAQARMNDSARYLNEIMGQVPVLVIGAIQAGAELPENQAGLWGSLFPAAWSFALALRARGLGSTWTSMHLAYEQELAEILGLPADVHQGVMFPVAYTKGTDFKPGPRADLDAVLHLNGW